MDNLQHQLWKGDGLGRLYFKPAVQLMIHKSETKIQGDEDYA